MIQPSFHWSSGKQGGEKRVSAGVCSDGGSTSWGSAMSVSTLFTGFPCLDQQSFLSVLPFATVSGVTFESHDFLLLAVLALAVPFFLVLATFALTLALATFALFWLSMTVFRLQRFHPCVCLPSDPRRGICFSNLRALPTAEGLAVGALLAQQNCATFANLALGIPSRDRWHRMMWS